jgi:hypothetical protein
VRAKIEYSLNGGVGWTELEPEFVSTDQIPAANIPDHEYPLNLSPSQDPAQVRVRGTLTVRLTSCQNCTLEGSHVVGSLHVSDIRMEVAPPTLTVSPDPVTRGSSATFEVKGAPGGTISNWVFSTAQSAPVQRSVNPGATTWPGTIVEPGTATVRVVLSGTTYNLSKDLSVTPRNWAWPAVSPQPVPNGTFATLPSPPVPGGALGMMEINQPYSYTLEEIGDNGPNHGFKYLTEATNLATFRYQISPDLENTGSAFYLAQCGNYSQQNPNGFIGGAQLLSNTQEHEFGNVLGHYQQYVAAQNDPNNNVGVGAEVQVAGPAVSQQDFMTGLESNLDARGGVILSLTTSESACNSNVQYDTSCVFRGFTNFAPYQSCQ